MPNLKNIAVFASGTGTNAQKIIEYFKDKKDVKVKLIVTNRPEAGVLEIARAYQVDTLLLERRSFYKTESFLDQTAQMQIDFIALAGFLWLIPEYLVKAFEGRMVNIHPALLPKFGGKGMYGMRVHEAVAEAGELETGITIHYVNDQYDEGAIIFQARCKVSTADTPTVIAKKVQQLEHQFYPPVLDKLLHREPVFFE